MLDSESQTLKDILIGDNLITEEQMKEVEEEQERNGKSLKEVIIDFGILTEADILEAIGRSLGLEVRSVAVEEDPPREVIKMIDGGTARMLGVVPLSFDGTTLNIITRNPLNYQVVDEVRFIVGKDVNQIVVPEAQVEAAIEKFYPVDVTATMHDMLAELNLDAEIKDDENPEQSADQLEAQANEAPIIKFVDAIMYQAIKDKASDIHFEPFEKEFKIRCRIDGALYEMAPPPKNLALPVISRVKIMSGLNISERRRPQDGRINFKTGPYDLDLRFSTIPTLRGESLVMRLLRKDAMACDLKQLGIPVDLLHSFEQLLNCSQGMILVVGPTGSGKTTTLYSSMMRLNDPSIKIITVEDPVEYQLPGLNQMQMNPQIGLTFADGLRHILRQDPDVILVGEIRDRETAEIAIQAAQTGHLVLSTLHTNDAAGAVTRLVDMGIPGFLINSALLGVLSQRLVRRVCTVCNGESRKGKQKCRHCGSPGYRGRIGIYELLIFDEEIRQAVKRNCSSTEINDIAVKNGMTPLLQCGRNLIQAGITTEEELSRAVTATAGD